MKRDIFKTLKHDSCELKIIKENDKYLLGCKTCGETLYSTEDENILPTLVSAYKICKKERANNAAEFIKKFIFKTNYMQKIVRECFAGGYTEGYIYKQIVSVKEAIYQDLIDLGIDMEKELLTEIQNYIDNNEPGTENKVILCKNSSYVISNRKIEYNDDKFFKYVIILDLDRIKILEEQCPTVKDVKVVDDVEDFIDHIPCFFSEEDDDEKYNEFVYRIDNNLYDFSSLSKEQKEELLSNALKYYFSYDCTYRYESIIRCILKLFNINI